MPSNDDFVTLTHERIPLCPCTWISMVMMLQIVLYCIVLYCKAGPSGHLLICWLINFQFCLIVSFILFSVFYNWHLLLNKDCRSVFDLFCLADFVTIRQPPHLIWFRWQWQINSYRQCIVHSLIKNNDNTYISLLLWMIWSIHFPSKLYMYDKMTRWTWINQ